ncbi:hypothetical protein [Mycolicibacterium brumae]|uniref:hypothetical protein n=1 Tax=Mycolicibacterium brumae TaxID=85968 RepID=UPI000A411CDA|nr:hypothetical protein [Mycolicibacterium brumae]MCV7192307.1 hypothetical protein [Mycolicibacterium brumae]UWW10076.1 hypothetical protein L2Z93_003195 [Mycolicibacterium brumae]
MTRPKIICHMHTLLNGKIDGIANPTERGMIAQREYFNLIRNAALAAEQLRLLRRENAHRRAPQCAGERHLQGAPALDRGVLPDRR